MGVFFTVENIEFKLKDKLRIKKWISEVIKRAEKRMGEINYQFSNDENVFRVNQTYLNHDTYTDIITFDYVEGDVISGDILISVDRVKENAETFGIAFEQELHRVIIHGVLHLLGNADKTDKEAANMRKLEEQALQLWNELNVQ